MEEILQTNQIIIHIQPLQMLPDAVAMRICDEELAVTRRADPFQELVHPCSIQFFKYIIQQNDGCKTLAGFEDIVFSQFHGKEQAFALTRWTF